MPHNTAVGSDRSYFSDPSVRCWGKLCSTKLYHPMGGRSHGRCQYMNRHLPIKCACWENLYRQQNDGQIVVHDRRGCEGRCRGCKDFRGIPLDDPTSLLWHKCLRPQDVEGGSPQMHLRLVIDGNHLIVGLPVNTNLLCSALSTMNGTKACCKPKPKYESVIWG